MVATVHVCDNSCPAPATHRFTKGERDLIFCDHHTHEHEHKLTAGGFTVRMIWETTPARPAPEPEPVS